MKLSELNGVRTLYRLPRDTFVRDLLIPCFRVASGVRCMFGFFNSQSLREFAPGLAEYLARNGRPIQLIVSPHLSAEDIKALDDGVSTPAAVLTARLSDLLGEARVTSNALVLHTLTCLSYLLAERRIEIKIARVRNGLFHPKIWIFDSEGESLAAHGSSNLTLHGLTRNVETLRVEKSWGSPDQAEVIRELNDDFETWWGNKDPATDVIPLPQAIRDKLLTEFHADRAPTAGDYEKFERVEIPAVASKRQALSIPATLQWECGPFRHQGDAVKAWEGAGRRGILAMATGAGKTITAMVAAARLSSELEKLLVIISAPYKVLIQQWEGEVKLFGIDTLPLGEFSSGALRVDRLRRASDALQSAISTIEVAVVTEDFLTSEGFRRFLDGIPVEVKTLLIADEVHNLGAASFIDNPPQRFDYRLGLSATPRRQYDPSGTARLFDFFGAPVFEYSLEQAIGTCLVRYEYFLHPVQLTDDEFNDWKEKTAQLIRAGFGGDDCDPGDAGPLSSEVQRLLTARRAILEAASGKIATLMGVIGRRRAELRHTLVYTTDKKPAQMTDVNGALQARNILFHQLTAEETADGNRSKDLLDRFAAGDLQIITCKRVLDEGVNIPQIVEAHLLASNTVERQWIQRRGRILRRCPAINKRIAHLHDYLVVPPIIDRSTRSLLRGELRRAHEFARLADNAGDPGGPLEVIDRFQKSDQ